MTAIWLLSTRGRPRAAQDTIDACMDAGMTSPGVVYVDEDDGSYRLKLPRNWTMHREPRWVGLQGSMQWCLRSYPSASAYGWLADDTRPRSRGWDKILEGAAGNWNIAYARDLWFSENPGEREQLEGGFNLSSGLCWGGTLVRKVGWWALPGVIQAGIDTAWLDITRPLGLTRYRHDVIVEHLNWRTGKRPYDDTDRWDKDGSNFIEKDLAVKDRWFRSRAYRDLLRRLAPEAPKTDPEAARDAIRQSFVDQVWREGKVPASRIDNFRRAGDAELERLEAAYVGSDADEGQAGVAGPVRPVRVVPDVRRF